MHRFLVVLGCYPKVGGFITYHPGQARRSESRTGIRNIMKLIIPFTFALWVLIPAIALSQVIYDPNTALVSISPNGRLLSEILTDIAVETGLDIYINPDVDKQVYVDIHQQSLEVSLKKLIRPLNNVMIFQGKKLTAIKIFRDSDAESTLRLTAAPSNRPSKAVSGHQSHTNKQTQETEEPEIDLHSIPPSRFSQAIQEGLITREMIISLMTSERRSDAPPDFLFKALKAGLITQDEFEGFMTPKRHRDIPPHTEEPPEDDPQAADTPPNN